VLLAHIGFVLKEAPAAAAEYTVVPLVLLLLLVGLVCSETRTFHLWWQNEGDSHGTKQKAWMGAMWLASFQVDFLLLGYAFATTAVVLLLVDNGGLDGLTARLSARLGSGADEASAGRRALHDGYLGDLGDLMSPSFDQDAHDAAVAQVAGSWAAQGNHSLVLLLLGLGLFSKSSWLMYNALTPFQARRQPTCPHPPPSRCAPAPRLASPSASSCSRSTECCATTSSSSWCSSSCSSSTSTSCSTWSTRGRAT
jgi:hypothetical protein